jgi:uncharacterized protein YvpB
MVFGMKLAKSFAGNMGVNLSGRDISMAEQQLNHA